MDLAGHSGKMILGLHQKLYMALNICDVAVQQEHLRQLIHKHLERIFLCLSSSSSTVLEISTTLAATVDCPLKPSSTSNTTVALIPRLPTHTLERMECASIPLRMLLSK